MSKTHGLSNHPLYIKMESMKGRCYREKNSKFYMYGARGITICEEWLDLETGFVSFYEWCLANNWEKGLEIDRIDNNGPYAPWNCRFVTGKQNCRNTRRNKHITVFGETLSVPEAVEKYSSLGYHTVRGRINTGWDPEEALITPVILTRRKHPRKT